MARVLEMNEYGTEVMCLIHQYQIQLPENSMSTSYCIPQYRFAVWCILFINVHSTVNS